MGAVIRFRAVGRSSVFRQLYPVWLQCQWLWSSGSHRAAVYNDAALPRLAAFWSSRRL